jgi:putrescine transport system substrate-binding protein
MTVSPRLSCSAALLAVLLTACGGGGPPAQTAAGAPAAIDAASEEKLLNLYIWSDFIAPDVIPAFEQATGIKVNVDFYDSNEVLETKMLVGNSGYDLAVPSASFFERMIKAGVFRPLDRSLLTGYGNLDPDISARIAAHDPGNAHGVNYLWGTTGIGYDEAKIAARLPDAPVDSLRMVLDPAIVSKFADCGVTVLDAPTDVVGTVLIHLGLDPNSEKPEDLKAAEDVLLAIRPHVRYVHSSRYIEDLANGEVCLSLGWSGDVLQARDRAAEAGNGVVVRYRLPKEGAMTFYDMLAIPKDAKHPGNAHRFIDYLLRPEVAARNTNFRRYANGNVASLGQVDPLLRNDPDIYPPADAAGRLRADLAESPAFTRLLTRSWTRFKTGQ